MIQKYYRYDNGDVIECNADEFAVHRDLTRGKVFNHVLQRRKNKSNNTEIIWTFINNGTKIANNSWVFFIVKIVDTNGVVIRPTGARYMNGIDVARDRYLSWVKQIPFERHELTSVSILTR